MWGCVALGSFSRNHLVIHSGGLTDGRMLLEWLLCHAGWAALTPVMVWLVKRYPVEDRPGRNLAILAAAGAPMAWLAPQAWWLSGHGRAGLRPPGPWLGLEFALYCCAIGLLHLLRRQHTPRRQERELAEAGAGPTRNWKATSGRPNGTACGRG